MPSKSPRKPDDQDSPWKEALERLLPHFVRPTFPAVHAAVDWARGWDALDKEFQQIVRTAAVGKGLADKLFKVWLRDGREAWVLVHVEVQGTPDAGFPRRMFLYNVRAYQLYNRDVVSVAVLTDDRADWRPNSFAYGGWGSRTGIEYLVVKVRDYAARAAELETDPNPFAAVVLAQLKAMETRGDPAARYRWKVRVVRGPYDRGWGADQVRELFRLVDWLLDLPAELQESFREDLCRFEEEKVMPYVTSIERLAIEKGRMEGHMEGHKEGQKEGHRMGRAEGRRATLVKALTRGLRAKFPRQAADLVARVKAIEDLDRLDDLLTALVTVERVDEFRSRLAE